MNDDLSEPLGAQFMASLFMTANHPRGHVCTSWMWRERPGKPAFIGCLLHHIAIEVELGA